MLKTINSVYTLGFSGSVNLFDYFIPNFFFIVVNSQSCFVLRWSEQKVNDVNLLGQCQSTYLHYGRI